MIESGNIGKLMEVLEGYYGPYEAGPFRDMVVRYLETEFDLSRWGEIFKIVMKGHFRRLGVPCAASIEKAVAAHEKEKNISFRKKPDPAPVKSDTPVLTAEEEQEIEAYLDFGSVMEQVRKRVSDEGKLGTKPILTDEELQKQRKEHARRVREQAERIKARESMNEARPERIDSGTGEQGSEAAGRNDPEGNREAESGRPIEVSGSVA